MTSPAFPTFSNIPISHNYNSPYPNYTYSSDINYQPNTLTRSRILEQNKYAPNQQLYTPLKTALTATTNDKANLDSRRGQFAQAARKSRIATEYLPMTQQKVDFIKNNTFMIEEPLRPTSNFQRVEGKHFYVLDANQRLGVPLNEMQFKERLWNSRQKQMIVYEPTGKVASDKPASLTFEPISLNPIKSRPKPVAKYNLYSCLDEPYERVKKFGCKGFVCPANQVIAATHKQDWLD